MRELFNFLAPHDIAPGRARILMPDHTVREVERIPDWYWSDDVRIIAHTSVLLRDDVSLVTYFTCEEASDGSMFVTSYATSESPNYWIPIHSSRTIEQAKAFDMAVRAAWGPTKNDDLLLHADVVGFSVPPHPSDFLDAAP